MRPIAVSWEIALRLYFELHERRLMAEERGLKGRKVEGQSKEERLKGGSTRIRND